MENPNKLRVINCVADIASVVSKEVSEKKNLDVRDTLNKPILGSIKKGVINGEPQEISCHK